jgi:hypothetical protein
MVVVISFSFGFRGSANPDATIGRDRQSLAITIDND